MKEPGWLPAATRHWANEFDLPAGELFARPSSVKTHGSCLADYKGIFALFREGRSMISIPEDYTGTFVAPGSRLTADSMAAHFESKGYRVIGPAFVGYATDIPFIHGDARCLDELDRGLVGSLQSACSGTEWEHGGSDPGSAPFSAVVIDGTLAALAGYEVWAESIAHISVLTHPAFRGRGLGRQVVGHLANRAIDAGLVAQYRTLKSNVTSMKIAAALGFQTYATSVAVRLAERADAMKDS